MPLIWIVGVAFGGVVLGAVLVLLLDAYFSRQAIKRIWR